MTDLVELFETANKGFLKENYRLLVDGVSERTLCGTLSQWLRNTISVTDYSAYHVDVEYNRNAGRVKTIYKDELTVVSITCDLIVHSRGEIAERDNLIAIEIKKSTRPHSEKENDRARLVALTRTSYDGVWYYDGNLPEHVCGYGLGVYYEINRKKYEILIEYYMSGKLVESKIIKW